MRGEQAIDRGSEFTIVAAGCHKQGGPRAGFSQERFAEYLFYPPPALGRHVIGGYAVSRPQATG